MSKLHRYSLLDPRGVCLRELAVSHLLTGNAHRGLMRAALVSLQVAKHPLANGAEPMQLDVVGRAVAEIQGGRRRRPGSDPAYAERAR